MSGHRRRQPSEPTPTEAADGGGPLRSPSSDAWDRERASVAGAFDLVSDLYRRQFADELAHKPFDRALLERVAELVPSGRPVLEVGAGPGHIGAYVAALGVPVACSDASTGQLRQARALDPGRALVAADVRCLPTGPARLGGVLAFYCLIYGPVGGLDDVFADWRRSLVPGGLAVVAVHAGEGTRVHHAESEDDAADITVVLRDPEDMTMRMEGAGFEVLEVTVRAPYAEEGDTRRAYVLARVPVS